MRIPSRSKPVISDDTDTGFQEFRRVTRELSASDLLILFP